MNGFDAEFACLPSKFDVLCVVTVVSELQACHGGAGRIRVQSTRPIFDTVPTQTGNWLRKGQS